MIACQLDEPVIAYLNADCLEQPWVFAVGNQTTLDDFTGCSIIGGLFVDGVQQLDLASGTARTVITLPSTVSLKIPQADVALLPIRDYQLSLVLVTGGGAKQPLLVGTLKVQNP